MMKSLITKIAKVMEVAAIIPKGSTNSFFNYKYRSHEDIVNKLRPALAAEGLILFPKRKEILEGSVQGHVLIRTVFCITDGENSIDFEGLGEGKDVTKTGAIGDKAMYKAQTGATKYALNDIFMIASQDDPEKDDHTTPHTKDKETYEKITKLFTELKLPVEQQRIAHSKYPNPKDLLAKLEAEFSARGQH